jgi:cytochrome bd-type quinol oxidase subunit 2
MTRSMARTAWFVGASLGALVAWSEPVETADVRFTRDGWSVLGWLCVFLLPVVGIALGLLLRARGSRQGLPMVVVSVAAIGLYALLVQIV